jgi:hypothetical protein
MIDYSLDYVKGGAGHERSTLAVRGQIGEKILRCSPGLRYICAKAAVGQCLELLRGNGAHYRVAFQRMLLGEPFQRLEF